MAIEPRALSERDEPRPKPYLWPTWISPLIAGDKHCLWATWYRAHFRHEKLPPDAESENRLARWKAEHGDMVTARTVALRNDRWIVRVERQNKLTYYGEAATVGGCPDLTATRFGDALISDCKSGKERDADFWQVLIYMLLAPLTLPFFKQFGFTRPAGEIVYRDRVRAVPAGELFTNKSRIVDMILLVSSDDEPARVPSPDDCRFCDIASCPDRFVEEADDRVRAIALSGDLF